MSVLGTFSIIGAERRSGVIVMSGLKELIWQKRSQFLLSAGIKRFVVKFSFVEREGLSDIGEDWDVGVRVGGVDVAEIHKANNGRCGYCAGFDIARIIGTLGLFEDAVLQALSMQ